jgi:hypothetical protein
MLRKRANDYDICDSIKKAVCERFSKQLLDIGDGKVTTDETSCIQLPTDFCTIIDSQDALIDQIFPNVHR